MHSYMRRIHGSAGDTTTPGTKGLVMRGGWRYDAHAWFYDTVWFRGQGKALRRRAVKLANAQPGEHALDVGCGTGALALEVQRRTGATGRVVGVDPSAEQIERARAKAAHRRLSATFAVGVIERLEFPDQSFDVVFSTLMLHHLPAGVRQQGLAEVVRVLKPGGRLVIADFKHKGERQGRAARFHAGGSHMGDMTALVAGAGFERLEVSELAPLRFSTFPGAVVIVAYKPLSERTTVDQ